MDSNKTLELSANEPETIAPTTTRTPAVLHPAFEKWEGMDDTPVDTTELRVCLTRHFALLFSSLSSIFSFLSFHSTLPATPFLYILFKSCCLTPSMMFLVSLV
jgi:hypothetical protein